VLGSGSCRWRDADRGAKRYHVRLTEKVRVNEVPANLASRLSSQESFHLPYGWHVQKDIRHDISRVWIVFDKCTNGAVVNLRLLHLRAWYAILPKRLRQIEKFQNGKNRLEKLFPVIREDRRIRLICS
jgi:hypothetical protein